MNAPRTNAAAWGEAGRAAGKTYATIANTTRKYSPKAGEIEKLGIEARSQTKIAGIKAEQAVRKAQIGADALIEKTQISVDKDKSIRESKKGIRKAGMVAAAGQAIGVGLMKDEPAVRPEFGTTREYLESAQAKDRSKRDTIANAAIPDNRPETTAPPATPAAAKSTNTLGGPKSGGWNPLSSVIRYGEGTTGDRGYTTQFTGTQFSDMSKHPAQLRSGGGYTSDAAGAYQFLSTTYKGAKDALGLKDFSPESQEKAGRYLTQQRGVNPDQIIQTKDEFKGVMDKLAPEWASLPYSGVSPGGYGKGSSYYGQGGKNLDTLWSIYQQNL